MCGLAGAIGRGKGEDVGVMLGRIAHRGPDGRGRMAAWGADHGHARLALFDLSEGSAQPFRRAAGVLSFNGEIWNHREVRKVLEAEGERFSTTGDTEVLAAALGRWGVDAALPRLEGMFAFAWSTAAGHVLARDRYGKIPLYVLRRPGRWEWASERKAWPTSAAGEARPLPPGSVLDLETGAARRWYELPSGGGGVDVLDALRRSVRARLSADAPVCVLASGGVDSSTILALAREARPDVVAYAAVLDGGSEDLSAARRICAELGVPLREVAVPAPTDASVREAVRAIEIPSKAQVEIALLCVPLARRIALDGFKACLTGEGADELFGGYGNMCIKASKGGDALWRRIRVEQLEKMSRGNFVRCNKAFMAAGVEARLPFLAPSIVEPVLAMGKEECPPGKKLLREAAEEVIPRWAARRPKDTFQGASGMAAACERLSSSPARFYNAEVRTLFGKVVDA